jgi:hypothetical protein
MRAAVRFLPFFVFITLFSLLLPFGFAPARAQGYFGKNKVQYKDFHWMVLETEHFRLHFYEEEEETARLAVRIAERSYARLSRLLDHEISRPIPLVLYASHADFEQTNVTHALVDEGTGGFTEFLKRRVALPFTGSLAELEYVLTHELVHAFQIDILFGGEKKSALSPFRYRPPLWIMEGMAEYLARGEVDPQTAIWVRDAVIEGYLVTPDLLERVYDLRVYRFGQAVFAYLARHYGEGTAGRLLVAIRALRDVDAAFETVLGTDLAGLSDDWLHEEREIYYPEVARRQRLEDRARAVPGQDEGEARLNLGPAISPDGSHLAFFSDRGRTLDLYVTDLESPNAETRRLVTGSRSSDFETLHTFRSTVAWSPDNETLALSAKRGGGDALYLISARDGKTLRRFTFGFDEILCPSFHPDGDRIVFVGLSHGRSDLYEARLASGRLTRLTDDLYAERDPRYSPDGRFLVFVTDAGPGSDLVSLRFGEPRIALLEIESGVSRVLPRQEGRNHSPRWAPDGGSILFVSDRTGTPQLFLTTLADGEVTQVTDLLNGVSGLVPDAPSISWCKSTGEVYFSSFSMASWSLHVLDDPRPRDEHDPGLADLAFYDPILYFTEEETEPDSMRQELALLRTPESSPGPGAFLFIPPSLAGLGHGEGEETVARADAASGYPPGPRQEDEPEEDSEEPKLRPYRIRFRPDYVVSSTGTHTQLGVYGQTYLSLTDLLGNHRILLGATIAGSIQDAQVLLSYQNLAHRLHYGASIFQSRENWRLVETKRERIYRTETWRGGELFLVKPFHRFFRVEGRFQLAGAAMRDYERSTLGYLTPRGGEHKMEFFARPMLAFVYDDAVHGWLGPEWGTRTRVSIEQTFGDRTYTGVTLDYRHYFPLDRNLTLAFRLLGAGSVGDGGRSFVLGGPHTLRGYGYGDVEGERVGLLNLELRFPLVEELWLGWPLPLRLAGIQGVLFFDGATPLEPGTRLFTSENTPLFRTRDLLASTGFGMRLGFGFFLLKLDFAQRVDFWSRHGGLHTEFSVGTNF